MYDLARSGSGTSIVTIPLFTSSTLPFVAKTLSCNITQATENTLTVHRRFAPTQRE